MKTFSFLLLQSARGFRLALRLAGMMLFFALTPHPARADCAPYSESLPSVGYKASTGTLMACNGTNWVSVNSGGSLWTVNGSNIYYSAGSIAVGANDANASAVMDLSSTSKGFLPPRMTTTQRNAIASPATGLMIFNTSLGCPQFWSGSKWVNIGAPTGSDFFDDGSAIATYFFENSMTDEKGSFNGTSSNITYAAGKHGYASVFNGSNSLFQSTANMSVTGASPRSLSLWAYVTNNTVDAPIMVGWGATTLGNLFAIVPQIASTDQWGLWGYGSPNDIGSGVAVTLNTWHHVVGTYDGTTMKLYLDGAIIGTKSATLNTSSSKLVMGQSSLGYYSGRLDTVRIFNRALSAAEVLQLYQE